MKDRIDIPTHHYFPFFLIALGVIILPIAAVPIYPALSIAVLVLSFLLTSTHYRLRIELKKKTYREYLWLAGFKRGEVKSFEAFEEIFISPVDRSFEYGMVARGRAPKKVYSAYLNLKGGEGIFLFERRSETKVLKKAEKLAARLQVPIRKNY